MTSEFETREFRLSPNSRTVLRTSARLYGSYRLKRVYYSAFSPIPDASAVLPLKRPPCNPSPLRHRSSRKHKNRRNNA